MKSKLFSHSLFCGLTLLVISASAHNPLTKGQAQPVATNSYKVDAGDCRIPVSQIDLNINNVRARILNAGDMWWDFSNARYEVPKGDGKLPINAIFAGAIWISGLDAGGNLKIAAQTYRQGNSDFWSGPIYSVGGTVSSSTCDIWDKHFNVYGSEIKDVQQQFASSRRVSTVPDNVAKWPGKGNKTLESLGFDMNANLAPFHDEDKDGIYDPLKGDYPVISCSGKPADSYADQMIFWTMNDKGNTHTATTGQPMGISIDAMAFAFQTTDEVNNMTFYTYNISNQSNNVYSKTYMTQFVDPDLGCSENDRIGCDTSRSLGIVYNGVLNGNPIDNGNACLSGTNGYGAELPMLGFDFFEGPIDTGKNAKQLGMSSFQYFNRANTPRGDPNSAAQYRNYQTGFWRDGSLVKYGGDGYGTGFATPYVFPGDPSIANQWSECNPQVGAPIDAGDRRLLQTSGPFTFLPGSTQTITIGVVFVRPAGGVTAGCPSFNSWIGAADDKAQALFNTCFKLVDGPDAPNLSIRELDKELILNINNAGTSNNVGESYDKFDALISTSAGFVKGMDSTYTFQGYKIYQLKDDKVSATDLEDPTKALLLTEEGGLMDIKDNVKRLVNYTRDPILNIYYPTVNLELPNNGIAHSLRILKDKFTGSPLVNHKTYYYAAVAFASNEFKKYDPGVPTAGGQKTTFLQGAKNFSKYSAIPHGVESRNNGSTLQSLWGDAATVLRIEGANNGGNELNLTQQTVDEIVAKGFKDTLEYVKTFDPIGFKVTDPILLKEANFELQFVRDTANKVRWELRDLTNTDTIRGDRAIESPYEQSIFSQRAGNTDFDYGFSLKLGAPIPVYKNVLTKNFVYAPLGGTIEYKDPSKPWLSFIKDAGQNDAANWIRSGNYLATGNPNTNQFVFDANRSALVSVSEFTDSLELFDKIADGTWAPYCLTPSYSSETGTGLAPLSVYGPGFKWDKYGSNDKSPKNNLDLLQSVDIVFTPDKSKWTHCIVFETGEVQANNRGVDVGNEIIVPGIPFTKGSRKGMIRMDYSWNKDGTYSTTDVGRSWFPGYAVNVETGERLNLAFGESSDMGDQNGRDMIWNPTANIYGKLDNGGAIPFIPLFGGKHFIYVMRTKEDEGLAMQTTLLNNYEIMNQGPAGASYPAEIQNFYNDILYASIPYMNSDYKLNSVQDGLILGEMKVRIRVQRPYTNFATNATFGDTLPRYQFSTIGMGVKDSLNTVAKSALDLIRIVPNPYLAYSSYETASTDARIKITNLPNKCSINIYTLEGVLVRTINRSVDGIDPETTKTIEISDGARLKEQGGTLNLENTAEWDLTNEKNIPVASGIYLFDINAPGIGHKILKWFGALRPTDVSNF